MLIHPVVLSNRGLLSSLSRKTYRYRHLNSITMSCVAAGKFAIQVYSNKPELLKNFQQHVEPFESDLVDLVYPSSSKSGGAGFAPSAYFAALKSERLGQILLSAAELTSTQEFMRQNTNKFPEGALCVADRQTAGKGRGSNLWTSPEGCLMFTFNKFAKITGVQAPFINYVVCLGVTMGIEDTVQGFLEKPQALNIRIKWPNDIYAGSLKIGGALIHTTWRDGFTVVTGIGLNVSNSQPTTCINQLLQEALTSSSTHTGSPTTFPVVTREVVLANIMTRMEQCFQVFETQGFAALEAEYLSRWLHSGQKLLFGDDRGDSARGPVQLVVEGLSASGFLLARDADGVSYELTPDGNSLDMMAGLIRRKI